MTKRVAMINEFFGFSENPFNATPDPRYLFLTESHQEALASMMYGIREKKGFVCVSGEVGTGKTTLIRHLMNILESNIKTVLIYQTLISFEELLKEIILELELPLGDQTKTHLIRQLNDYLIERHSRDEIFVLIIDEAQHLSQEVLEGLRLLSNLETDRSKLLQIILAGQTELEGKLDAKELRQFKQRIGIWRRLKPLTDQESRKYIEHRLSLAGSTLERVFTPEAVSLISQYAQGIPRTINILCDNAFLIGYALSKKRIGEKIIEEVLGDLGLLNETKRKDQSVGDKDAAKGQCPETVSSTHPSSISGGDDACVAGSIPRQEGILAGQRANLIPGKTSPSQSIQYRRLMAVAIAVVCLLSVGFVARGALPGFSERAVPDSFRPSPIKVNHQEWTEPKPQIERIVIVERGATISSLAQEYYSITDHTVMDHILTVNPDITNPDYIREGQTVKLPEITEDSLILQGEHGDYRIWLETFGTVEGAGALRRSSSLAGNKIDVLPRPVSSTENWYRGVTGHFETRGECLMAIRDLKIKGALSILKE